MRSSGLGHNRTSEAPHILAQKPQECIVIIAIQNGGVKVALFKVLNGFLKKLIVIYWQVVEVHHKKWNYWFGKQPIGKFPGTISVREPNSITPCKQVNRLNDKYYSCQNSCIEQELRLWVNTWGWCQGLYSFMTDSIRKISYWIGRRSRVNLNPEYLEKGLLRFRPKYNITPWLGLLELAQYKPKAPQLGAFRFLGGCCLDLKKKNPQPIKMEGFRNIYYIVFSSNLPNHEQRPFKLLMTVYQS